MAKKMRIFDFADTEAWVDLKDKTIAAISVTILSGDEVVTVYYEDGDTDFFDSSKDRMGDFNDGYYIVEKGKVDEWMAYAPQCANHETMSYKRQEAFSFGGKFCDLDALAEAAEAIKEAD